MNKYNADVRLAFLSNKQTKVCWVTFQNPLFQIIIDSLCLYLLLLDVFLYGAV